MISGSDRQIPRVLQHFVSMCIGNGEPPPLANLSPFLAIRGKDEMGSQVAWVGVFFAPRDIYIVLHTTNTTLRVALLPIHASPRAADPKFCDRMAQISAHHSDLARLHAITFPAEHQVCIPDPLWFSSSNKGLDIEATFLPEGSGYRREGCNPKLARRGSTLTANVLYVAHLGVVM